MRKKLIALAVAGAVAAPLAVQAADVGVSGFADILYTAKDERFDNQGADPQTGLTTANSAEDKFSMDAELDFTASQGSVSARVDIDLELAGNGNASLNGESGRIEQAFAAWNVNDAVTFLGGVINNPLGMETEDAPGLYQTSHGQIYGILDGQTALDGNNVVGAVAAFGLGMVDVTAGVLNDLQQANEEQSFLLYASAAPVENLNVEAGFVSQADNDRNSVGCTGPGTPLTNPERCNGLSAENVFDINGTYVWNNITVGAEYLGAGAIVDTAFGLFGNVEIGNGFGGTVRWDTVSYDTQTALILDTANAAAGATQGDTTVLTLAGTYSPSDNLTLLLEWSDAEDDTAVKPGGDNDHSTIMLEIVATLGDYKD